MAVGDGSSEPDDYDTPESHPDTAAERPETAYPTRDQPEAEESEDEETDENEDDEDDDGEEEEPKLKYATLTRGIASVYRNGDATSSCIVGGDKMIIGTHNGNVHVLLMPSLQSLKTVRAHNATVSAISVSPFPPPLPMARPELSQRITSLQAERVEKRPTPSSPNTKQSPRQPPVPKVPSNDIFIATASIDGNVCISSLIDSDDIQLRNFGRPVHAVALSPEFRSDRLYLSGGSAGSLVVTVGGQKGKTTNASTTGAAATASGWLGSIGLGGNSGTDRVLHSGEGAISTIKWSLSGKYVLWVNETGIKFMYSHIRLPNADSSLEWKRISHTNRPDTAGAWKARAEWIDRSGLELEGDSPAEVPSFENGNGSPSPRKSSDDAEEVLVGWGDTVWLYKITASKKTPAGAGKHVSLAEVLVTAKLCFSDCTISGVQMYTSNLLLVLAHMEKKASKKSKKATDASKKGRPARHNGLQPELRIIDITTQEEVDTDTLEVSRYETLSSSDYHLCVLSARRSLAQIAQRGYLESIGSGVSAVGSGLYSGVETVGQGMLDATMYGPRKLGVNRLFSGTDSIRSGKVGHESSASAKGGNYFSGLIPGVGISTIANDDISAIATTQGMKIFMFSPYDCIVGIRRSLSDRLQWLVQMKQFQSAWELLDEHPEAAGPSIDAFEVSTPGSPSRPSSFARSGSVTSRETPALPHQTNTLAEFFEDSISISSSAQKEVGKFSKAQKEKRRIGELWVKQLVDAKKWSDAGEIAGKVLDTTSQWDNWVWIFIRHNKFDEISPYIPTFQITPPLSSSVFEITLGHYVSTDRARFKELLDQWPSDLFEVKSIISAIDDQLQSETAPKGSQDWRILQECLAKLCLADGDYQEALRCYIRVHDADTALSLIKDHHLIGAIRDDIASFVLLRIPRSELTRTSVEQIDELSSDPIGLLVDEASHGVVEIDSVVRQLQAASLNLFLYFYLRALWRGEGSRAKQLRSTIRGRAAAATNLAADEGKLLVEQHADTAVEIFAEYDRTLLMDFLHTSSAYTYDKAVKICEKRRYVEELVYLLSKTGAVKKALFLIIDELKDVSKAIAFAKEQDDKVLWNDFLEYSMSRPQFISGLLAEVGTAIDPIELVKRIPSGLEIEGLKDGLKKMLREYDIQDSLSSGVAKVLSSEVGTAMDILRRGRRRGIKFEVPRPSKSSAPISVDAPAPEIDDVGSQSEVVVTEVATGHCAACDRPFVLDEKQTIVGFVCGHVYHVAHLLREPGHEDEEELSLPNVRNTNDEDDDGDHHTSGFTKSVGSKVTNARLLRDQIEQVGGCKVCRRKRERGARS